MFKKILVFLSSILLVNFVVVKIMVLNIDWFMLVCINYRIVGLIVIIVFIIMFFEF